MQTIRTKIRPGKTSGLIWIQTVRHSGGIPDRIFENAEFEKKTSANGKTAVQVGAYMVKSNVNALKSAESLTALIRLYEFCKSAFSSLGERSRQAQLNN